MRGKAAKKLRRLAKPVGPSNLFREPKTGIIMWEGRKRAYRAMKKAWKAGVKE